MDYTRLGKRILDERLLLRDNLQATGEDGVTQEINNLLYEMDAAGKEFLLDVVKRYKYYHGGE